MKNLKILGTAQQIGQVVRILVVGGCGSGVSTLINKLTGQKFSAVGHSVCSTTTTVKTLQFASGNNVLQLVELPAFNSLSDTGTKTQMVKEIMPSIDRVIFVIGEVRLDIKLYYQYQEMYPGFFDRVVFLRTKGSGIGEGRIRDEIDALNILDYEGTWKKYVPNWNNSKTYAHCPLPGKCPPVVVAELVNPCPALDGWRKRLISHLGHGLPPIKAQILELLL